MTGSAPTGTLQGWRRSPFSAHGRTHDVFERGEGPGVVLIPEVPGISPEVLGFADHLVREGFTVVVPSPFGTPGRPLSTGYVLETMARLCVSSEFRAFATDVRRPITDWLRAVAIDLAGRTPGPGVAVIGMCFTGGFALAAAVEPAVLAAVMSQPGVPFPVSRARKVNGGLSTEDLETVGQRADRGELCAMGLRFSEDGIVPPERFATVKARLGDAFEVIQLDSSRGNPGGFSSSAHSVLTGEVREQPGHPAFEARARVVAFLRERLTA